VRPSRPRGTIAQALARRYGAFTAEELVDELQPRGVGRATVYRALELLERLGMLTRMHLDDRHAYTVCDAGYHHHMLCSGCGAVLPVDATGVEAEIQKLAAGLKFRLEAHTLEFVGRCEACQAREAPSDPLVR